MPDPCIVTRLRVWSSWLDERVPDTEVQKDLREAADEIERLRSQRDEARRFMCCFQVMRTKVPKPMSFDPAEAREYANQKGWDCFEQSDSVQNLTPEADSADTP